MRVLCLHGRGTSGGILETQIEGFRRLFPDDYEYVFLDGEKEHAPAPGVEKVFPGPYCSYLTDYTTMSMADQHDFVAQVIAEEGPFDAVLGFSQYCSTIKLSKHSTELGVDVTDIVPANERLETWSEPSSRDSSEENLPYHPVRRLTPDSCKAKLLIPTAHIYGSNDTLLNESLDLVKMCDSSFASTYMHGGGHDIPMDYDTSVKIRDTIEIAVGKSQMLS